MARSYLFGVDLEEARLQMDGGERHECRTVLMTERLLAFLERHGAKGTFFVVGNTARTHPDLVRSIIAQGHEIACHSDLHRPLERQTPQSFREDLLRNLDALSAAGASNVLGYRAPFFSLTSQTAWVYPILAELGFSYSSSVLPARNPIYGWPGFGSGPRLVKGILELPITLVPWPLLTVPIGGGVYFRTLPGTILRYAFSSPGVEPVTGYIHPYDIDEEQERFAFPGFSRHGVFNRLMYYNRGSVFPKLEMVAALGFRFAPYGPHAQRTRRAITGKETDG